MTSMFIFSKDSKSLAVGTGNTVSIWDVKDAFKKEEYDSYNGESGIQTISYSADERYIYASLGRWGTIDVIDLKNKNNNNYADDDISSPDHSDMYANAVSPDGKTFVYADGNKLVFWDYKSRTSVTYTVKNTPERIQQLMYSPDSKHLAVGYSNLNGNGALTSLEVNETKREKPEFKYEGSFEEPITFVTMSPDSTSIAFGHKGKVLVRNLISNETKTINGREGQAVTSVSYMPAGRYIAIAYNSGTIDILDTKGFEKVYSKECGAITIAFSPDGRYLAVLSKDKTIRFWDSSSFLNN